MKADFEKLLDAIGNLEKERSDLESELEKAKKVAELNSRNGNNAIAVDTVAVEKMKERFLKVTTHPCFTLRCLTVVVCLLASKLQ